MILLLDMFFILGMSTCIQNNVVNVYEWHHSQVRKKKKRNEMKEGKQTQRRREKKKENRITYLCIYQSGIKRNFI